MACVRKEIVTFCGGLPQMVKAHGVASIGPLTVTFGNCFLSIGTWLDRYSLTQPLPGLPALPRVSDLGEQLRVVGLEIWHAPNEGQLQDVINTLRSEIELLERLAKFYAERRTK